MKNPKILKKRTFQPLIAVLITVDGAQCTCWTNILCWTNVVMMSNDVYRAYKIVIKLTIARVSRGFRESFSNMLHTLRRLVTLFRPKVILFKSKSQHTSFDFHQTTSPVSSYIQMLVSKQQL